MTTFLAGPAYRIICWALFALWFVGLNILSSLASPDLPDLGAWPHLDKVFHFLAFGTGGFLLSTAAVAGRATLPVRRFVLAFFVLLVFGLADEMRQLLIPGRTGADLGDFIANFLGTLAGVLFSWFLHAHFLSFLRTGAPPPSSDE